MNVLDVTHLGKSYCRYASELHRVASWFGLPARPVQEQWVLRGVSFTVAPGETIGIVGQNGAGKSTLLKLITGTQRPAEGHVRVSGRISAILELGMGFNPEFTGRQNASHGLGLTGFSYDDVERVMPALEAFAEIDGYFDAPVRTYSSGMQMRVAFAVATAFRPDVLIVDEVLSVGDAYFQHKCMARIREYREEGTALLIVSHDPNTIQALCDRAILLESGVVIKDGAPEEVLDYYNAIVAEKGRTTVQQQPLTNGRVRTTSGTGEAHVESIGLYDSDGQAVELVNVGQPVELRVNVRVEAPIPTLVLGYMIKDRLGQTIYGTNTWHTDQRVEHPRVGSLIQYSIRFPANLGPGSYSVSTAVVSTDTHLVNNYEWRDLALVFSVANHGKSHFEGCAWIEPVITISLP